MEYLNEAILLFGCLVEMYIVYDFFDNFFERKSFFVKYKYVVAVSILFAFLLFAFNLLGNAYINLFVATVLFFLYSSIIFRANIGSRLIYLMVSSSIFWGCEYLFAIMLEIPCYLLRQTSDIKLSEIPWQMLTMKLLTYFLFTLVKQCSNKSRRRMNSKVFSMYLCVPVANLGIMFLSYYSSMDLFRELPMKVCMSICVALMVVGNILIFYAFNRYSEQLSINMNKELIIARQKADLGYYAHVREVNEKYKKFIHNTSHYLKTIGDLAKINQNDSIVDILKDLNVELESNVIEIWSENHVLNAILNEKKVQCEKREVVFDVYVEPGIRMREISDMDMITMLGNLMDNACYAANKGWGDKFVKVRIFMQNEGHFFVVKIINNFSGEIIKSEKGFVSTKKESGLHGIGVLSVQSTAEKYSGYLECFGEQNIFTAILVLSVA